MFVLNLLLAMAWLLLTGQFTPLNFVFGLGLAYGLLWLFWRAVLSATPEADPPLYFRKVAQVISFGLFFVKELLLANLRVAIDVLRPNMTIEPAVVAVPLADFGDGEAALLANFITLTPGTLSLDVVDDPASHERILYIHAMHAGRTQAAVERFRAEIQQHYARRVQEVMS